MSVFRAGVAVVAIHATAGVGTAFTGVRRRGSAAAAV